MDHTLAKYFFHQNHVGISVTRELKPQPSSETNKSKYRNPYTISKSFLPHCASTIVLDPISAVGINWGLKLTPIFDVWTSITKQGGKCLFYGYSLARALYHSIYIKRVSSYVECMQPSVLACHCCQLT